MKEDMKRREFLKSACAIAAASSAALAGGCRRGKHDRPNVVLIMTDDQGYGDVRGHGNEIIRTPNLDALAAAGTELTRFYVCPTCAPTRAGLLTGRYHLRTGILGVMSGEALIDPGEVTVAKALGKSGYRTGIFGKWHLGDDFPRRPIDMGFEEAVVHRGGGLSQPAGPDGIGYGDPGLREKYDFVRQEPDYPWLGSNTYFDPLLEYNGRTEGYEGYCTDIFFDEAISFIGNNRNEPFFAYIPTNAPHAPEYIGEEHLRPYREMGLDDTTARCYAMITNIDGNIGRLMNALERFEVADNTIVIFLGDNGPQHWRYNAGLRGRKGGYYEGGIRVPFYISWPGKIEAGRKLDFIGANIDIFPTLLEACGAQPPRDVKIDGKSLLPLLTEASVPWPDRTLYFQGPDGIPEPYNHCAVVTQRYKMVDGDELYDLALDPGEANDIASDHPEVTTALRRKYEEWFDNVWDGASHEPQRLYVGAPEENPVTLTPQDWRGPKSRFVRTDSCGYWLIDVRKAGRYRMTLRFRKSAGAGLARIAIGDDVLWAPFAKGDAECTFPVCSLAAGTTRLEAWLEAGQRTLPPAYVDVCRIG